MNKRDYTKISDLIRHRYVSIEGRGGNAAATMQINVLTNKLSEYFLNEYPDFNLKAFTYNCLPSSEEIEHYQREVAAIISERLS